MKQWLFFFTLLIGCSPRTILYLNEKAPFERYSSYIIIRNPAINDKILSDTTTIPSKIEQSIHKEMEAKQYKRGTTPDLALRYEIISNAQITNNLTNFNYLTFPVINLTTFVQSTILLELSDVKTKKLVWQASVDVKDLSKITKDRDPVKEVVPYLFSNFPYVANNGQAQPKKKK